MLERSERPQGATVARLAAPGQDPATQRTYRHPGRDHAHTGSGVRPEGTTALHARLLPVRDPLLLEAKAFRPSQEPSLGRHTCRTQSHPLGSKRLQEAPRDTPGRSQTFCGGPPEISISSRLLPTVNPMRRLSGDQKGSAAPSVPAKGRASIASRSRTHSCVCPSCIVAVNAKWRPSGETARPLP